MVVRSNEPYQPYPNLTWILTLRAKPTQLNPNLNPKDTTWLKNVGCVQIGFINKAVVKNNTSEGQSDFLNLKVDPKIGLKPNKRVRFSRTSAWCVQSWVFRGLECRVLKLNAPLISPMLMMLYHFFSWKHTVAHLKAICSENSRSIESFLPDFSLPFSLNGFATLNGWVHLNSSKSLDT